MKKQPQGRRLIALLKRRAYTNMEMLQTGISTCPWRRVIETLRDDEQVIKVLNGAGLVTWRVVSATRWTA